MNRPVPLLTQTCPSRKLGRFCALFVFSGAESGILSKVSVWSLLSTENERNLGLRRPTYRLTRKTNFLELAVSSPFCTKNGARRSGDDDKFGGRRVTSRNLGGLPRSEPGGCRAAATPELRNWAAFAHFFDPKASGDKAEANGDKLSGLEFACFSGQKAESRARRTSGARFRPKTSEFGGSGTTFLAGH